MLPPRLPRPQQLAELSDGDLAELTALLVNELKRRMTEAPGRSTRPDLKRAFEQIASALQPPASKRRPPSTQEPSLPIDAKRNAIRAALSAGIKPTQVAKHFGVSLADVWKGHLNQIRGRGVEPLEASLDVIVTPTEDGKTWTLADLLGRSMGCITQTSAKHYFIEPEGHALETMSRAEFGPYASLDAALAQIEKHTRGVCRRAPEEDQP